MANTTANALGSIGSRLKADVSNSTTTLADCTGLSVDVDAGMVYTFHFWVIFQSAAIGTGIQLALAGPTGAVLYNVTTPTSATASTLSNRRGGNTGAATAGIDTANANTLAMISGICAPTAAGTVIVRFASSSTTAVTIKAGSTGMFVAV